MSTRRLDRARVRCTVLAVLACLAAAPAAASAVVVGISDQHEQTFSDLRFRTLPIDHVRLIVPWDAALTDPAPVDAWLQAAAARHLTPMVAFERSRGDQCPDDPCHAPSRAEFADAFAAFRLRWPGVREFTPWNEPNNATQPYVLDPQAAAALHDVLRTACPACTVVAGDMVDNASMKGWFADYRAALKTTPLAWGIHNYGDVSYERASYLEWLLGKVAEPVWVTETGGIVRLRGTVFQDDRAARAAVEKALALADAHADRVPRLYLYQWQAALSESFDAGLIDGFGTGRPALEAVRNRLGEVPARPEPTPTPVPQPDSVPGEPAHEAPGVTYAGMPLAHQGTVVSVLGAKPVAVTALRRTRTGYTAVIKCPAVRRNGCHGRVSLVARGERSVRLGSAAVRIAAGRRANVRVRVPARKLKRARTIAAVLVLRQPSSFAESSWSRRALK